MNKTCLLLSGLILVNSVFSPILVNANVESLEIEKQIAIEGHKKEIKEISKEKYMTWQKKTEIYAKKQKRIQAEKKINEEKIVEEEVKEFEVVFFNSPYNIKEKQQIKGIKELIKKVNILNFKFENIKEENYDAKILCKEGGFNITIEVDDTLNGNLISLNYDENTSDMEMIREIEEIITHEVRKEGGECGRTNNFGTHKKISWRIEY